MGDVRHRTVPCLKILLGGFLLFIRGIMVFLPIIIVVIMMLFLRKKTHGTEARREEGSLEKENHKILQERRHV